MWRNDLKCLIRVAVGMLCGSSAAFADPRGGTARLSSNKPLVFSPRPVRKPEREEKAVINAPSIGRAGGDKDFVVVQPTDVRLTSRVSVDRQNVQAEIGSGADSQPGPLCSQDAVNPHPLH